MVPKLWTELSNNSFIEHGRPKTLVLPHDTVISDFKSVFAHECEHCVERALSHYGTKYRHRFLRSMCTLPHQLASVYQGNPNIPKQKTVACPKQCVRET